MLRSQIQEDIKQAMRGKDQITLDTLRYIWSEIKNEEITVQRELTDDEVLTVLSREVKKRKEAISQFKDGGREELAEAEVVKLEIITHYLPTQLSEAEVRVLVDEVVKQGVTEFGVVMKVVMEKVGNLTEGKVVAQLVKERLAR